MIWEFLNIAIFVHDNLIAVLLANWKKVEYHKILFFFFKKKHEVVSLDKREYKGSATSQLS